MALLLAFDVLEQRPCCPLLLRRLLLKDGFIFTSGPVGLLVGRRTVDGWRCWLACTGWLVGIGLGCRACLRGAFSYYIICQLNYESTRISG